MSQMVFHFIPVTMHLWLSQQLEPESAQKCPRRQEKKEKKRQMTARNDSDTQNKKLLSKTAAFV